MILAQPAYERTSSLSMRSTPDLEMSGWACCSCWWLDDGADGAVFEEDLLLVVTGDAGRCFIKIR